MRYALLLSHPAMSQVQACSALHMAESAVRADGTHTWDDLAQALAEGRQDVCGTIDAHDLLGTTALHFAAHAGAANVVRALVAAGASLDPRTQTSQVVLEITLANNTHACTWQVERGWTPLLVACRGGHHECVSVLVAAGASVHASLERSLFTETTLTLAAEEGCLRSVQILLDAGASVRVPANSWSPLHASIWGCEEARYECAVALLRAGADVNALDHMGRSPLDLAITSIPERRAKNRRLISTLLREGARLPAANHQVFMRYEIRVENPQIITYIDAIRSAGGYARYETMRRAPFVAAFTRCGGFPLPSEMISIVVAFWVQHALEY